MADVSLDDLIKQDKDKQKAQRSNVLTLLCRRTLKRNPSTNKDHTMTPNKTQIKLSTSQTSLTSKINHLINRGFKAKNSKNPTTLKGQKNSNRTTQEKSLKEKRQSRKKNYSEP